MSELVAQRFCAVAPHVALERAVHWLGEHGYQVSARTDREAQLFHPGGLAPQPPSHRLRLRADGKNLELGYQAASVFDASPGPAEEARLEQLADALVKAVTERSGVLSYGEWSERRADEQAPPVEPARFCTACGTRAEPGATRCALCDSPL